MMGGAATDGLTDSGTPYPRAETHANRASARPAASPHVLAVGVPQGERLDALRQVRHLLAAVDPDVLRLATRAVLQLEVNEKGNFTVRPSTLLPVPRCTCTAARKPPNSAVRKTKRSPYLAVWAIFLPGEMLSRNGSLPPPVPTTCAAPAGPFLVPS